MLTAKYMHPENGYPDDPSKSLLEVGREYEVEYIAMGQSYTSIYIKGFHDPFNSILFDFFEDGDEINIYKSPKYNPYIDEVLIDNMMSTLESRSLNSFKRELLMI